VHRKVPAGFGGRLRGKGPQQRDLAAQPILLLLLLVEHGGGVPLVDDQDAEPEATAGVVEIHEQVAGQMYQPGASRVRGDPQDVYPAGGVLDDEERVQPVRGRWCRCGTCRRPRSPVPALGRTATRSDRSAVVRGRSR